MPRFADTIVAARAAGKRPAALVVVSDGQHGLNRRCPKNPVVVVDPKRDPRDYAFRFLADLHVEIATVAGPKRVLAWSDAVLPARPRTLRFWFLDTDKVLGIRWELYPGVSINSVEPVLPQHYEVTHEVTRKK